MRLTWRRRAEGKGKGSLYLKASGGKERQEMEQRVESGSLLAWGQMQGKSQARDPERRGGGSSEMHGMLPGWDPALEEGMAWGRRSWILF